MLTRVGFVVSSPFRIDSELEFRTITAPFSVIVKEIDGVSCRFVSEDGVFTLAEFGNFHRSIGIKHTFIAIEM